MVTPARVYFGIESYGLDQLRMRGARAAFALADRGVSAGDVIAILMRNEPRFIEALTCIRCLDARRVLIPWHLTAHEIRPILTAVRPRVLIVHRDLLGLVSSVANRDAHTTLLVIETPAEITALFGPPASLMQSPEAEMVSWDALVASAAQPMPIPTRPLEAISLTSGTTGRPKIIRWQGKALWVQWAEGRTAHRPAIRTSIVTAPLYHGGQYGAFSHACLRSAHQVILPKFDAEGFLLAVERYRVNHAYMVPTMFVRLLKLPRQLRDRYDVSSLNYVLHTGAACPPDIKRQMIDWLGPVIWEAYGCSEMSVIAACSSEEWLQRPGTVGRPLMPVQILNRDGSACASGTIGEIYVNVSGLPRIEYENGAVRQRAIDGMPWLAPGDAGSVDADGYLYVAGRSDDLINTGRVKVYPLEIENVILMHPAVRDCAVFAIPDPEFGQIIGAAVDMDSGDTTIDAELSLFLRGRLSEHKIPALFTRLDPQLRNGAGKMNRTRLRDGFMPVPATMAG